MEDITTPLEKQQRIEFGKRREEQALEKKRQDEEVTNKIAEAKHLLKNIQLDVFKEDPLQKYENLIDLHDELTKYLEFDSPFWENKRFASERRLKVYTEWIVKFKSSVDEHILEYNAFTRTIRRVVELCLCHPKCTLDPSVFNWR